METDLQLYISIPFCPGKCAHCQKRVWPYDQTLLRAYSIALTREIAAAGDEMEDYTVRSVYFGGGVPPVITARVLRQCLAAVKEHFHTAADLDVELETVPANFTEILCTGMARDGLTHMICGLGTLQRPEWELLNRPYDYVQSLDRLNSQLETHRPPHLTLSVLYGIPGQTEKRMADTLRRTIGYKPQCIRLDPIGAAGDETIKAAGKRTESMSEEEKLARLTQAEALLSQAGYRRYSLRDYALPGSENRFEQDRLADVDRLGLGAGAASHYDGVFYSNTLDLHRYFDHSTELDVIAENIVLPTEDYLARRRALLRLSGEEGLSAEGMSAPLTVFAGEQLEAGSIIEEDGHFHLTPRGILHFGDMRL